MLGRPDVRFGLMFIAVAGVLFALYAFPYAESGVSESWFQGYLRAYARAAGGVLAVVDGTVHVSQDVIAGRYALRIVKTCDAMEANLLFVAAVVAFPAPWRRKVAAAVAGLGALVAVNILRICSLYFVGVHLPTAFAIIHLELWPLAMVAIAAGLFLVCARWMKRRPASLAVAS